MPSFAAYCLPAPQHWQAFEDLCCDLFGRIWGDPTAQKNGRQRQPQRGADVYGQPHGDVQKTPKRALPRGPSLPPRRPPS